MSDAAQEATSVKERAEPRIPLRRSTIRTQLLLAVNLPLVVLMVMLLVADYRQEMQSSIMRKQVGLQEEALTIAHGLSCLSQQGRAEPIQRFVDRVCAGMQETRSPGHHIAVRVGDNVVQAQAHHRASPEMLQAMRNAAQSPGSHALLGDVTLVVGSFSANDVEVYVSENTTDIRQSIHNEMLSHSISLAALGVVAAGIVNLVLLRLVVRPLQQLSGAVARIAQGDYAVQTNAYRSHELIGLSEAIRQMASTLANNEQERHLQMDRARKIQDHLLPNGVEIPGLAVAHYFQPADSVAGDYYDLMRLRDETWLVCVADVTGHGVAAAMGSVMLKALVMHAIERHSDPQNILRFINHQLPQLLPSEFITMFLGRWNPETCRLDYASAGHEPGLLFSPQGEVRELPATGLPLGIDPAFDWETAAIDIVPGQRLVLTTDGVAESSSPAGELFGRERLAKAASSCGEVPPQQMVQSIRDEVLRHQQGQRSADDVTILVLEATVMKRNGE
jgi:serine phosphatase RsbU (regulator of sigma subunit)